MKERATSMQYVTTTIESLALVSNSSMAAVGAMKIISRASTSATECAEELCEEKTTYTYIPTSNIIILYPTYLF